MPTKNQTVAITITGMTAEGNGAGRHEGFAVFVPLTAIGDVTDVQISPRCPKSMRSDGCRACGRCLPTELRRIARGFRSAAGVRSVISAF